MPYYFAPAIGSGLMEMLDGAIKFLYEQIISIPGESSESHAALAMKQVITAMTFSDVDTKTISAVLSVITPVAFLLMVINFMAGLAKSGFDGRPGAQDDMLDMTIRFYIITPGRYSWTYYELKCIIWQHNDGIARRP